ncbi:hypothetical protein F4805DRAFT_257528 [Annulohypoxylon moriforme]|nr:hypothetical protein F4805DRAFT_257528 [Annulohypoxylon moriforme]
MQWAADRETTRPEDTAYCLLGIFEINMPLLYGEGNKAFLRLQEEICKQNNDLTLFAWTIQLGHTSSAFHDYRGIFATHPCEFTGFRRMRRIYDEVRFHGEFAVTNKGLRFDDIQLYKSEAGLILPVDCLGPDPNGNFPGESFGILLMLTLNGYIRREPGTLAVLPRNRASDIPPHRIYVLKQAPLSWIGFITPKNRYSDAIFFKFQGEVDPIIMNVIPQESFDYNATAFLTGPAHRRKFFGYMRLHVNGLELIILCWIKSTGGQGDGPISPPEAQYSFAIEGEDGWDRFKTMLLEKEITNRAVQEGIIPSLLPDPKLRSPHDKIIAPLGSTGIEMVLDSTMASKRRYHMVVTFLRTTKRDFG